VVGAGDRDFAALQRLAQRVESLRLEFRQLVEEEHAVMRERDLAGPGAQAAADQRRHAGGMVRAAERPPVRERAAFDLARDRGDHRHLQQFRRRQRRQDGGEPRRQHRLAGAGRSDHQQDVSSMANAGRIPCHLRLSKSLVRCPVVVGATGQRVPFSRTKS
jgi:hypothetical protein